MQKICIVVGARPNFVKVAYWYGITEQDVTDIMQTGVSGIAVSGAVLNADNPIEAMRRIGRFWE